jgi:hypothetical protein
LLGVKLPTTDWWQLGPVRNLVSGTWLGYNP